MRIRNENLKAYLGSNKGSASRIAKRLGVTKGQVSHWKDGSEPVPEKYNEIICEELGRSLDDLCKPFSNFPIL